MLSIWIVTENGELYKHAYNSRELAILAVEERHKETLFEQRNEANEMEWVLDFDDPEETKENSEGTSYLYIEKGIHITIQRFRFEVDIVIGPTSV